jgi:hypothetical protein
MAPREGHLEGTYRILEQHSDLHIFEMAEDSGDVDVWCRNGGRTNCYGYYFGDLILLANDGSSH